LTKLKVPLTKREVQPEAPRASEKEKFKCDCKEMEIADTLLTQAMMAF
jgi:hypothetical protein